MVEESTINISDKIPSGPWTLYFHQGDCEKWTLETFLKIQECVIWSDVLGAIEEVGNTRLKNGQPFFMKGEILPLWENYQNIRGGSYSVKVPSENVKDVFTTHVLQAMLGLAFKEAGNNCVGISMSPKKGTFNIMKIWNIDSEKFNDPNGLCFLDYRCSDSEVLYTPHVQKRM